MEMRRVIKFALLGEMPCKHHNVLKEVLQIHKPLHETDVGAAAEISRHGETTTTTKLHSNSLVI
jgi:hypothetical protein